MSTHFSDTEKHLIAKSKELFYELGKFKATSQEIADFANVQRTLVNYYFRSKENLFKIVHTEIIQELHAGLHVIYKEETISFEQQIENLIEFTFLFKNKYPFFEVYNVFEANDIIGEDYITRPKATQEMKTFIVKIEEQMSLGVIKKSHPVNFVLDVFALVSYPLVLKGIYKYVFDLTDESYDEILKERKTTIKNLIFNK
jgi:AcrR family transcriptional regulator